MPEDERIEVKDAVGDSLLNASSSTHNLPLIAGVGANTSAVSEVERAAWQQEKERIYKMLDDKVYCCSPNRYILHVVWQTLNPGIWPCH